MSMMRASGAMPIITALQIATASLAVPKSVMKTIVGRAAGFFAGSLERLVSPPQPANASVTATRNNATQERVRRNGMPSPLGDRSEDLLLGGIRWAGIITHAR